MAEKTSATPPPSDRRRTIPRERLDLVRELWLQGEDTRAIQRVVAERFAIKRRQVRTYIARVRAQLATELKSADPAEARARAEAMLLEAFATARGGAKPDAKAMVMAAQRYAELHGVMAPQKLQITGSLDLTGMSGEQLHARATALLARATGGAVAPGAGPPDGRGAGGAGGPAPGA
jgi:hypothetical protein